MKKLFLCGLASFLLSFSLVAQAPFQGKVLEGLSIESKILGTTVNYSIYLPPDCGDDDFLYKGNSLMHIILRERGVDHEYRVRDGSHNWEYWRTGIYAGLKFISQSFHR